MGLAAGHPVGVRRRRRLRPDAVKEILDHGRYWSNRDVGAPFGQTAGWFADASWVHYAIVKVFGLVSSSPGTVSALYFFVCFPLAALTAYWLARTIEISRTAAVCVGVLFSVLPGHQLKFAHLWLAGYWVVPLALSLVLVVSGHVRADLRGSVAWTRVRDTRGLSQPTSTVPSLTSALGSPIATSSDGVLVGFDLRGRRAALVSAQGSSAVEQRGNRVLYRLPESS